MHIPNIPLSNMGGGGALLLQFHSRVVGHSSQGLPQALPNDWQQTSLVTPPLTDSSHRLLTILDQHFAIRRSEKQVAR